METPRTASEQLFSLTQQMLLAAQNGKWDTLTQLEQTRLPLFDQVFAGGIADNVELARQVLAIDEQTKDLVVAEMPRIQSELQKMKNASKANAAYQFIESFSTAK